MKTVIAALLSLGLLGCGTAKPAPDLDEDLAPQAEGVTLADLDAHAAKQVTSLEECYASAVDDSAKPGGAVVLTVGISGEGYVTAADAYTETLPELIIQCMVDAVTQWPPFPARGETALTVMKPFKFILEPTGDGNAKARFVAE
jgi:hypothetical protein